MIVLRDTEGRQHESNCLPMQAVLFLLLKALINDLILEGKEVEPNGGGH